MSCYILGLHDYHFVCVRGILAYFKKCNKLLKLSRTLYRNFITVEKSQEEKRQHLCAKRTNEDTAMSAKERYLARKRANLLQLTISTDDD